VGDDHPMEASTTSAVAGETFRRPKNGRAFAGVAAALAARTGIGVGWIRAAFVVSAFFGGLGILIYAIGWLTIPDEGTRRSIAAELLAPIESKGTPHLIGAVLLTVTGLAILAAIDVFSARWVLIGGLAVLGVLLYRGEIPSDHDPQPGSPPPTNVTSSPTPTGEPTGPVGIGSDMLVDSEQGTVESSPALHRSLLGRLTLAAVLVTLGVLGVLGAAGAAAIAPVHFAAAALGVIGIGLIVGAFVGRARWLAVIGVLLLPVVLVLSALPATWSSEVGDQIFAPTSYVTVDDGYHLGAGTLELDLTAFQASATEPIVAEVGAGELRIVLPEGRGAVIDAEVGIGELRIEGRVDRGGMALEERVTVPGPDPIAVEANAGLGLLSISWEGE
jgi:phage shock protein PspC (stress-responsive transcriptional regulator)